MTEVGTLTTPAPPDQDGETRVRELLGRMTLDEKLGQLVGFWAKGDGEAVAPLQHEFAEPTTISDFTRHGLGHVTRFYGTRPVDPVARAAELWQFQRDLVRATRLGIPAIVHEECLTGLSVWSAATFPTPLAWGASFDPELVAELGAVIGGSMRALGIHQGLAPVLDVIRDPRWGRVDECIAEDPYLVGTLGTAYVQGLQSQGVHATLKHFVGYSASRAGRNFAPVNVGPRELADVLLVPFEMAILDGNARSVMHAYTETDGVPVAADPSLLTGVLRDQWGFTGTVVADYWGIPFLQLLHHIAADLGEAAALALTAGVDVELPTGEAYREPLAALVRAGTVDEALVDRAVLRVLREKLELGLLDATFDDEPPSTIDLDSPAHRAIARRLAEESVVLVANDGTLPIPAGRRLAVIGPNADRAAALFGCYSFVNHVLVRYPEIEPGFAIPTVADALRTEFGAVTFAAGCAIDDTDRSGFDEAIAVARAADVAVLVVGDQADLFGRGTVGEGCDRDDLELPGVQRELVEAIIETGTPVVLVLVAGRPYAVDWAMSAGGAVVQTFFPGEEGGSAIAGVLSGRINPSGRLPVSLPRSAGAQPYSYLHPPLGEGNEVTNLDTTPAAAFGHGLSYTTFDYTELVVPRRSPIATGLTLAVRVTNTGAVAGSDVVQLYGRDRIASVTRPVAQLLGYRRVCLEPGESITVELHVPPARLSFTDRALRRVVEAGEWDVWIGTSTTRTVEATTTLDGEVLLVDTDSPRFTRTAEVR